MIANSSSYCFWCSGTLGHRGVEEYIAEHREGEVGHCGGKVPQDRALGGVGCCRVGCYEDTVLQGRVGHCDGKVPSGQGVVCV